MSDVVATVRTTREVTQKPAFRMLRQHTPEVTAAVLRVAFPDSDVVVEADILHARVDSLLDELVAAGEKVPQRQGEQRISGRDLCREFVADHLLGRPADSNSYTLAPAAVQALELIERLRSDRALANSSRLNAILQAARELSRLATVDRGRRLQQLDSDITAARARVDELVTEHDRIAAGGDIETASYGELIEAYAHLDDLVRRLPTDLARVRESIDDEHRRIIGELRADDRSTGQAVIDHLEKTDALLNTPEGQAFQGVRELLSDQARLHALRHDISTILSHRVFQETLRSEEQESLSTTHGRLRVSMRMVQDKRDRTMSTLAGYIRSRGLVSERELGRVLNDLGSELTTLLATANSRTLVGMDLLPDSLDMAYLHQRFDVSIAEPEPAALADTWADRPEPPALADLVALGGPRPETVHRVLAGMEGAPGASIGDAFNALDAEFRRPVELWGLWQAAASAGFDFGQCQGTEEFHVIRPDGSATTFIAERIVLTADQVQYLQERENR
ncbi:DUF3375 family protein [Rhodococcus koreensis]